MTEFEGLDTWLIPDIHELQHEGLWDFAKEKILDYQRVILFGDVVDAYQANRHPRAPSFLLEVMYFVKNYSNVDFLLGNHEHAYLIHNSSMSGYQPNHAAAFWAILKDHKEYLKVALYEQGCLMTHAGVTEEWHQYIKSRYGTHTVEDVVEFCNSWPGIMGMKNGPLWARPWGGDYAFADITQIVGHTHQPQRRKVGNTWIIDTGTPHLLEDLVGQSENQV